MVLVIQLTEPVLVQILVLAVPIVRLKIYAVIL